MNHRIAQLQRELQHLSGSEVSSRVGLYSWTASIVSLNHANVMCLWQVLSTYSLSLVMRYEVLLEHRASLESAIRCLDDHHIFSQSMDIFMKWMTSVARNAKLQEKSICKDNGVNHHHGELIPDNCSQTILHSSSDTHQICRCVSWHWVEMRPTSHWVCKDYKICTIAVKLGLNVPLAQTTDTWIQGLSILMGYYTLTGSWPMSKTGNWYDAGQTVRSYILEPHSERITKETISSNIAHSEAKTQDDQAMIQHAGLLCLGGNALQPPEFVWFHEDNINRKTTCSIEEFIKKWVTQTHIET